MKKNIVSFLSLILIILVAGSLYSEEAVYHGADSVFKTDDIAVFWAVLKGTEASNSMVYICIVPLKTENPKYTSYSITPANVFTGEEEIVADFQPLKEENIITQKYGSFSEKAKRRIFLYRDGADRDKPDTEIYYIGVPDTAPEFLELKQINLFFNHALTVFKKE